MSCGFVDIFKKMVVFVDGGCLAVSGIDVERMVVDEVDLERDGYGRREIFGGDYVGVSFGDFLLF